MVTSGGQLILTDEETFSASTAPPEHRLPTVNTLDFRVGKLFKLQRVNFNVDLDLFNLFNEGTVLGRQYDLRLTGATGFNQVLEIMNPRIARIGVRFNF